MLEVVVVVVVVVVGGVRGGKGGGEGGGEGEEADIQEIAIVSVIIMKVAAVFRSNSTALQNL